MEGTKLGFTVPNCSCPLAAELPTKPQNPFRLSSSYVGGAIGEVVIGYVLDTTGVTGHVFVITAIVCLLGSVFALFIRR